MNNVQPPTTSSRHDHDDLDAVRAPRAADDGAMIGVSEFAATGSVAPVNAASDASRSALMRQLRASSDRCPYWRLRPSAALLSPPRTHALRRTAKALGRKAKARAEWVNRT